MDDYRGLPIHVIRELSRQLADWRALMPLPLQWSDDELDMPPEIEEQALDPASTSGEFEKVAAQTGRDVLTAGSLIENHHDMHVTHVLTWT